MPTPNPHEVSRLLRAWSEGDKAAMDQLIPLVYGEPRRLRMSDTPPEIAGLVREKLMARPGAERVAMGSRMFDAARAADCN